MALLAFHEIRMVTVFWHALWVRVCYSKYLASWAFVQVWAMIG